MIQKWAFLLALVLAGCASKTKQSDALFKSPSSLPAVHRIEGVPFVNQKVGHCGPATLTMAMNHFGKQVTVEEIAKQVYTPGMQGSFQNDMISAARRQGMLAIPIENLEPLLAEVAAGNPVIVFENLGISWIPRWHYALVFGYDLPKRNLILHSGPDAGKTEGLRDFERDWKLGDYWGLVVLPPGRLSATADELAHVKAAAALENLGMVKEADVSYRKILERWPESLGANIGAANISYSKKDVTSALRFLARATQSHPKSAAAWHNSAIALGAANKTREARESAKRALQFAAPEERAHYLESLKAWIQ